MKFYLSNRLGNISNINTTTVRWVDIKDIYFLKTQEVKFIVENDDDVEYIKNVLSFSYKDIASLLEIDAKRVDNILLSIRKKMEKQFLFS